MKIYKSSILPDVTIIEPVVFSDERGDIYTSYDFTLNHLLPKGIRFVHDKFVISKSNVLRGMHGDNKTWKLISCPYGMVYEVIFDPILKTWESFTLSSTNRKQILIPPGFLNGYYAYRNTIYHYKLAYKGNYTEAGDQITIKWDSLGIEWPCVNPILSERDKL